MELACKVSGIQVGYEFAAQFLDLVLEQQLALFQAPHLDLVNKGLLRQGRYTVIEITVFYDQLFQFLSQALFIFQQHHRIGVLGGIRYFTSISLSTNFQQGLVASIVVPEIQ